MRQRVVTEPSTGAPASALAAAIGRPTWLVATRNILQLMVLGVAPLAFGVLVIYAEAKLGLLGFDFKGTIWHPGREILAGHSPYPPPLASEMNSGNPSVYPPVALLLALPYAALPFAVAYSAWTATLAAGVVLTLRILRVRDWRLYTVALGSCPIVFGLALGNIVLLLLPLAACAWRYRDDVRWAGLAVGLAIALKLVLWPMLFWFVASRRWRAAFIAATSAVVSTGMAWAMLGFDGFRDYPRLLAVNDDLYADHSWSLLAGGVGLGLPLSAASATAWLLGLALLALGFVLIKRPDGDRRTFCIIIVASLALLPIVWPASLALLLVPLSLASRSLDRLWLLFLALWVGAVVPHAFAHVDVPPAGVPLIVWKMQHSAPPTAQIAVFALVVTLMTVLAVRGSAGGRPTHSI